MHHKGSRRCWVGRRCWIGRQGLSGRNHRIQQPGHGLMLWLMPIQKRWVVAKDGGFPRLRNWQALLIPAYQAIRNCPAAIPLPMCSRATTGRLLPLFTVPVTHGTCTSAVVPWATTSIRATITTYGVYEADTVMMLVNLVI